MTQTSTTNSVPYFSIGLTGGIGCGKSTVANLFAARGATIVDTDEIAHSLTAANGAAMPALLAQFDGLYDRDQSNPQTEKVMHQWRQAMEARLGEARLLVDQAVKP